MRPQRRDFFRVKVTATGGEPAGLGSVSSTMRLEAITALLLFVSTCFSCAGVVGVRRGVTISVGDEPVEVTRKDRYSRYSARLPVEVCFNGDGAVSVVRMSVGRLDGRPRVIYEWNEPQRLEQGRCLEKALNYCETREGDHVATVLVKAEDGRFYPVERVFRVRNSDLAQRLAKCEACNGEWGRHGMKGWEGCICRTSDYGEACDDGRDCEGRCMFKQYELVEEAHSIRCDDDGRCRARLATRRPVGECSEFTTHYG